MQSLTKSQYFEKRILNESSTVTKEVEERNLGTQVAQIALVAFSKFSTSSACTDDAYTGLVAKLVQSSFDLDELCIV